MADLPLLVGDSAMREIVNIPWPIRRISILGSKNHKYEDLLSRNERRAEWNSCYP